MLCRLRVQQQLLQQPQQDRILGYSVRGQICCASMQDMQTQQLLHGW